MEATKQITKSKAPFKYSPQLVVLRSSRNPVIMVNQVSTRIQDYKLRKGTTSTQIIVKKVINIEPAPVGLPLAASAVKVNSRPLSWGSQL